VAEPTAPAPAAPTAPPDAPPVALPASPPPPTLAQAVLRRLEAVLFVTAAVLACVHYARLPSTLPSDSDYQAASAELNTRARPGDAVLLDPHWAERVRLYVTAVPVLNLARNPTREDLRGYDRLHVLSLPDLPRSDQPGTFRFLETSKYRRAEEPKRFGHLTVTTFENTRVERPSFDFTHEVPQAKVYIRRGQGEELCPLRGNRHPCPSAGWINVGEELKEIAFKPQRCLWAHPAGSDPLVVEYPAAPLAKTLEIMGGIVGQIAFRTEKYGTVVLRVKIDGNLVAEIEFPPGQPGERRRSIDTSALAGSTHRVEFEISANNPDMRHFCFDAGAYP